MKHFSIGYFDTVNEIITLRDKFYNEQDALNALEKHAIKHIKKNQGKQQADVCHKTESEALTDVKFSGMFIFRKDNKITLMEKKFDTVAGYMWNSQEVKVVRLGIFMVVEYDVDEIKSCGCNNSAAKKSFVPREEQKYMEELKFRLSQIDSNFGLKAAI